WDVTTGKLLRTFEGHSLEVNSVDFSSDGRRALSGSDDNTLKLWDVATGRLLRTFEGHFGGVNSVAFSPDGRSALSGGADGFVQFWSLASAKQLLRVLASREGDFLSLTPAGFFDLAGDSDRLLHLVRRMDVLSIEQTFEQLYRPDLVEALMNGDL